MEVHRHVGDFRVDLEKGWEVFAYDKINRVSLAKWGQWIDHRFRICRTLAQFEKGMEIDAIRKKTKQAVDPQVETHEEFF